MKLEEAVAEALDILLESTRHDEKTVVVPVAVLHALTTECVKFSDDIDDNYDL